MAKGFKEFKKDLSEQQDLYREYEDILKKLLDERKGESDGDLVVSAAKTLGYDITLEELDRDVASIQELDLDEMTLINGGTDYCDIVWTTRTEDEKGHNSWCAIAWHCEMITCHTETNSKLVSCFKDYKCSDIYQDAD